jgi:ribonuclease BN (tRNA processing enzyme)
MASLISVAGTHYLIDAGDGVSGQLARAHLSERDVSVVFFTHLHDDHTSGLPGLMSFDFTRKGPGFQIIGPPGTARLVSGALAFLQPNAEIRMTEDQHTPPEQMFAARDVEPGLIYSDRNVRVIAVENSHFHPPPDSPAARNKSYALRFEGAGKVVVFTGDTGASEAVTKMAKGADILVSEMASPSDQKNLPPRLQLHVEQEHLSPAEVGDMAERAGVGTLVLSHLKSVTPQDLAEVRRRFSGKVVAGEDLQRF